MRLDLIIIGIRFAEQELGFDAKRLPAPAAGALLVTGIAFIAGIIAGPGHNSLINGVLNYSARSSDMVGNLGSFLPLGFAFAAGMVATVNPCGFVMLPAFLGIFISDKGGGGEIRRGPIVILRSVIKALYVSASLGLGFVILFGGVGLAVSTGARWFIAIFPWVGLVLGFLIASLGTYVFAGGKLYTSPPQSVASRIGNAKDTSAKGYFLFGVSYALASISCTLPIFLGLISSSVATGGILQAAGQFLSYALGMTFMITVLTIGISVFKGALVNQIRRGMPYADPISAGVLILVGGYLIFYWITAGEISRSLGVG